MKQAAVSHCRNIDGRTCRPGDKYGMDLLLWRHAEAHDGSPDASRTLTERGRRQAEHMAAWLERHLPADAQILVSPALRARQTAEALHRPFTICPDIGPDADAARLLAAAGWPDGAGRTVLLVGHQPVLGRIAALLLCGAEADWSIRKGALWWLSSRMRADETQVVLRVAMAPDFIHDKTARHSRAP